MKEPVTKEEIREEIKRLLKEHSETVIHLSEITSRLEKLMTNLLIAEWKEEPTP